ncbi:MAG: L-histidine N(alpha)-methyltransferase [Gemmatimonadaceae bacterium]
MSNPLQTARRPLAPQRAPYDDALVREVLSGLRGAPKTLPPKLFYYEAGAKLFEEICQLDEYYLTRTELAILRACVGELAELVGPRAALVEYGSGAGEKVRLLLDTLREPAAYVPIDISSEQLSRVSADLRALYPSVAVTPICADYTRPVHLPTAPWGMRRVAFFPGSTIGNFHPAEAAAFLSRMRRSVGPSGALILGVDRRKDERTLNAAYDDAKGVTAAFNLNLLRRLNRDLDADFDLGAFRHRAFFNSPASRIEMHLESARDQIVRVADHHLWFVKHETIWTESSYKYDDDGFATLVVAAGFRLVRRWTDERQRFWIAFLEAS